MRKSDNNKHIFSDEALERFKKVHAICSAIDRRLYAEGKEIKDGKLCPIIKDNGNTHRQQHAERTRKRNTPK